MHQLPFLICLKYSMTPACLFEMKTELSRDLAGIEAAGQGSSAFHPCPNAVQQSSPSWTDAPAHLRDGPAALRH